MVEWLSKIDPNAVIGLLTMIGGLATWIYHKIKNDDKSSKDDLFRGLGKQIIALLSDDDLLNDLNIRKIVTDEFWKLAGDLKIPRNPLTEKIASTTIEHIIGDLLSIVKNREALASIQGNLNKIASMTSNINAELKQ